MGLFCHTVITVTYLIVIITTMIKMSSGDKDIKERNVIEMTIFPKEGLIVGITPKLTLNILFYISDVRTLNVYRDNKLVFQLEPDGTKNFNVRENRHEFKCHGIHTPDLDNVTCWKNHPTCNDTGRYIIDAEVVKSQAVDFKVVQKNTVLELFVTSNRTVNTCWSYQCGAITKKHLKDIAFHWIIQTKFATFSFQRRALINNSTKCFAEANSTLDYIVGWKDLYKTKITCAIGFSAVSKIVNPN